MGVLIVRAVLFTAIWGLYGALKFAAPEVQAPSFTGCICWAAVKEFNLSYHVMDIP